MEQRFDEAIIGSLRLTRSALEKLAEEQLCQKVLIPLFRKMGFRDVQNYHGGLGEKGKDIVMWSQNVLGERENFGVLVIREPLNSKADPRSGGGAAGKVAVQINQMFTNPFIHSVSGEKRQINTCWVVTSKIIQKEAPDTILSSVGGSVPKQHVQFVDGEKLWALLVKHFPLAGVREKLDEMLDAFQSLAPGCEISFAADSRSRWIKVTPERGEPGRSSEAATFSFRPVFPDTDEGRKARCEFEEKVRFGKPLSVPLSNLADLRLPILAELLAADGESGEMHFRARAQTDAVQMTFDIVLDEGRKVTLPFVELKTVAADTGEVLLSNVHQPLAWKFEIKTSEDHMSLVFSMSFRGANANAYTLNQALQFWSALSKPGLLVASMHNNGIPLFMERTPFDVSKLMYDTPPNEKELKLFEALSQIQQRLGREFYLPDRDLTQDEIHSIFSVRDVLMQGRRDFGRVTLQTSFATKAAADAFLGVDRRGITLPSFRIAAPTQTYFVLEFEVDAGPCFIQTGGVKTCSVCDEVTSKFDSGELAEFKVKFECLDGSTAKGYFPKWSSPDCPLPDEILSWIEGILGEGEQADEGMS